MKRWEKEMEEWGNGRLKGYYYMAMKIQFHLLKIERVIFLFFIFCLWGLGGTVLYELWIRKSNIGEGNGGIFVRIRRKWEMSKRSGRMVSWAEQIEEDILLY